MDSARKTKDQRQDGSQVGAWWRARKKEWCRGKRNQREEEERKRTYFDKFFNSAIVSSHWYKNVFGIWRSNVFKEIIIGMIFRIKGIENFTKRVNWVESWTVSISHVLLNKFFEFWTRKSFNLRSWWATDDIVGWTTTEKKKVSWSKSKLHPKRGLLTGRFSWKDVHLQQCFQRRHCKNE